MGAVGIFLLMLLTGSIKGLDGQLRIPASVCILVLILAGIVYLTLALYLKCPSCSKRFLFHRSKTKHANARTKWGMDYWGYVVIDVLSHRRFVCMYCGNEYFVNKG